MEGQGNGGQGRALKIRQGTGRGMGPGVRGQHSGREGGRSPKQGFPKGERGMNSLLLGTPWQGQGVTEAPSSAPCSC